MGWEKRDVSLKHNYQQGTGKQIKASLVWSSRATKTLSEKQKQKQSPTNSQIKEEKKQWPINPALGFSATQQ